MTRGELLAVLGAVVGVALSRWLNGRAYRYDDEQDRPHRLVWWWLVPGLAVAGWALGERLATDPVLVVLTYGLALVVLAALMAIDLDVHRLPDKLTLPSYPVFAVLLAACSLATGHWGDYGRALVCGAGLFLAYLVLALISPGGSGLGLGDVKLAGVIGLLLGWFAWPLPVLATFVAFLIGGLVGVVLIVLRRATRKSAIAFGPAMILAAVLVLVAPASLSSVFT